MSHKYQDLIDELGVYCADVVTHEIDPRDKAELYVCAVGSDGYTIGFPDYDGSPDDFFGDFGIAQFIWDLAERCFLYPEWYSGDLIGLYRDEHMTKRPPIPGPCHQQSAAEIVYLKDIKTFRSARP